MPAIPPIRIIVQAVDRYSRQFSRLNQRVNQMTSKFKGAGQMMTYGLTIPMIYAGKQALTVASQFDYSMRKVASKIPDAATQLQPLTALMKKLATDTETSTPGIQKLGEALAFVAQAGWSGKDAMKGFRDMVLGAVATDTDVGQFADIVTNVMMGFKIPFERTGEMVDKMAMMANSANVNILELGDSARYAAQPLKSFEQTPDTFFAIAAMMGNLGVKGSAAGTAIGRVVQKLGNMSDITKRSLKYLGVEVFDKMNQRPRGMLDILKELNVSMAKLPVKDRIVAMYKMFGIRAQRVAGPISQSFSDIDQSFTKLVTKLKNYKPKDKYSEITAGTMTGGITGKLNKFKGQMSVLAIKLSESGLIEFVGLLTEKFSKLFQSMEGYDLKPLLRFAGIMALLGPTVWVLAPIVGFFVKLGFAISSSSAAMFLLSNPVGWVTAGLLALGLAISYFWDELAPARMVSLQVFGEMFTRIKPLLTAVWGLTKSLAGVLWGLLKVVWAVLKPFVQFIGMFTDYALFDTSKGIIPWLTALVKDLTATVDWLTKVVDAFSNWIGQWWFLNTGIKAATDSLKTFEDIKTGKEGIGGVPSDKLSASDPDYLRTRNILFPSKEGTPMVEVTFGNLPPGASISVNDKKKVKVRSSYGQVLPGIQR